MNPRSYEVKVAKEYETQQDGQITKHTAWNRVGRAWHSKSGDCICFELYLMPTQHYVIYLGPKRIEAEVPSVDFQNF